MPFVYVVRCANGALYTGWAMDVLRRVKAHNAGRGARYTRIHGPVELLYCEAQPSRSAAMKRELAIKGYSRARKLALCQPSPISPGATRPVERGAAREARPKPRRAGR